MFLLAHGIVGRTDLPIPEWLFGWGAAVVLMMSFVGLAMLWPKPRLQDGGWRALPGELSRALTSRVVGRAVRPDRRRPARPGRVLRLQRRAGADGQLRVRVRVRAVLDRPGRDQRAVRGHLPRLQPVAGAGPVRGLDLPDGGGRRDAGAAEVPRAAGLHPGRRRAAGLHHARAGGGRGQHAQERGHRGARLLGRDVVGMALYGVDTGSARARPSASTTTCSRGSGPGPPATGRWASASRCRAWPPGSRCPGRCSCWRS